jgi:hypothetical protein
MDYSIVNWNCTNFKRRDSPRAIYHVCNANPSKSVHVSSVENLHIVRLRADDELRHEVGCALPVQVWFGEKQVEIRTNTIWMAWM